MTSLKIVLIVKVENFRQQATVCATRVLLEKNKLVHLAKHALRVDLVAGKQIPAVKIAPKVFTKTKQAHRTACLVCLVNSKIQVANRFVINVQLTQQVKVPIQPPVNHVTLEQIPSKVVLNVPRVVLGHTVLDVKIVPKVNTVTAVILLRSPVEIAPPVTTMITTVRALVYHAFQGNSTILRVLWHANFAKRIPIQVRNIVKFPVNHALLVVHPNRAVRNVPIVHQVNSKTVPTTNATNVQQDGIHWNWMQ